MQQVWDNEEDFRSNLAELHDVNADVEVIKDQIIQLNTIIKDPRISGQISDFKATGERTSEIMVRILAVLQTWLNFMYQDYANKVVVYLQKLKDLDPKDESDQITQALRNITTLVPKAEKNQFNVS